MAKVALEEALSYITQIAGQYGVDPNDAQSILLAENMGGDGGIPSTLEVGQVSNKGASGLMQVMPTTRTSLIAQGRLSDEHSQSGNWQSDIHAGLASLQEIQKRTKTNDKRVLAAEYNSGPRGGKMVTEGQADKLPLETINYLKRFEFAQGWLQGLPNPGGVTRVMKSTPAGSKSAGSTTTVANIDAIEQMMKNNSIWTAEATRLVTLTGEAEVAANNQAAQSATIAGEQASLAKKLEGMVDAAGIQARERILSILGLDTRKVDNAVANAAAEFAIADPVRRGQAAVIDEKMNVGFFDNPLQYLINATQLPGLVEGHNATVRKQNDALSTVQTMQKIAGDQERIDIAASADQMAELGIARGNAIAAEGNQRAAQFKAQSASAAARTVTVVAGLQEKNFDNAVKVAQLQKITDAYREGEAKKAKEAEEEKQLDADLRRIGTLVGAPNMSLQLLKRMGKKEQQEWLDRVAANNIGNDLYEALTFIKPGNINNMRTSGSAALAETMMTLQKEVFNRAQLEAATIQSTGGKIPSREELLQQAARQVTGEFFANHTNMLTARPYNPYLVNHTAMATAWRGDPENIIAKTVRKGVENRIRYTDSQLFTMVETLIEKGKLDPKVAAQQISDYYAAGVIQNNKNQSFTLYGLKDQDSYNILPKTVSKRVNLLAPGELENIFTMAALKAKYGYGAAYMPMPGISMGPGGMAVPTEELAE